MKPRRHHRIPLFWAALGLGFLLSGCSITRSLDENQVLLHRNTIRIVKSDSTHNFSTSDLHSYVRQNPNKRIFRLIPFHAAAYNFGEGINIPDSSGFSGFRKWGWKRKYRFREWVMKNGEAPVVLDTSATDRTVNQFESFMFTKGHFNASAWREITYHKRKARVIYTLSPGAGHTIREVFTEIPSPEVKRQFESSTPSLIRKGAPYDEKVFQQERDRITRILKDSGFFHFSKAYILLEVDTFLPGNELDVYLRILDQSFYGSGDKDSVITRPHMRSRINKIFLNPEFEGVFAEKSYQVVPVDIESNKSGELIRYYLLTMGNPEYNPQNLIRNILMEPGQWYSLSDVEKSYLYLSDLNNFGNITITFTDAAAGDHPEDTTVLWLDCTINMSKMLRQSYELRLDATNRAGDPGVSTHFVYQNRNLLKGAEVMSLSLKGALEVQKILDKEQVETTIFDNLPFNTVELGADLDIRIPRFFAPIPQSRLPKSVRPRTRFAGGVNFQERPDYKRYIVKVTSGYEWQLRSNMSMSFNPFEINSVSIFPDPSFVKKIEALNDQRLKNSYSDHIITAMTWSVILDKQNNRSKNHYSFLRFNIESAGWIVNAFRKSLNYAVNDQGIAMVFNIPYAQYFRTDIDYRQFFKLRQKDQLLAARFYLGIGNPYGNMDVLPFEKSFYVGGGNGIRAWPVRTIGPGSFTDVNELIRFDRSGDFGLETSFEYRFPMYSTFHGALFFDAGNVWLKNRNDKYPGGEFVPSDFFRELALGTGLGIRIVTFFVIRVDAGIKLHDPSKPEGERWVIDQINLKRVNWNFGIGYSI